MTATGNPAPARRGRFAGWLLEGQAERAGEHQGPHGRAEQTHSWLRVMCLTGVADFSSLGYQPAIAAIAESTSSSSAEPEMFCR